MAEAHTHHDDGHEAAQGIRTTAQFILTGLSGGHAVFPVSYTPLTLPTILLV